MTDQEELFIAPDADLKPGSEGLERFATLPKDGLRARWKTRKGRDILDAWKRSGYSRQTLDGLIGRHYGHTDLRGIALSGEDLSGKDLSRVDLYAADLANANLSRCDLSQSWLSESTIKGAHFDWASMDGVLIDNVEFDAETRFLGVNLNAVNFNLAVLLQDFALSQQRIENLKRSRPVLAGFLAMTCDFGRSFARFFLWAAVIVTLFAFLYWVIPGTISEPGLPNSFYFSTVTFTTLGFGDIKPLTAYGKILVVLEVTIGYVMLGLLVAILSRKVIW